MPTPSLAAYADLAEHPGFRRRVHAAMVIAAKDVAAEQEPDTPTSRSQNRRALSTRIFEDLPGYTLRFAIAVATNPSLLATDHPDGVIPDGDIQFTVNSVWDAIAGAPPEPTA